MGGKGGPTTHRVLPLLLWYSHYEDEAMAQISFLKFAEHLISHTTVNAVGQALQTTV